MTWTAWMLSATALVLLMTIPALLTGSFAVKDIGGAEGSFATQAIGVPVTALILWLVNTMLGLRITPQQEGLDLELHGEQIA